MHVSVIICTYNRCESLKDTILAISRQATPKALFWELIIVDNNSRDNTRSSVESFIDKHPETKVQYVFEADQGLSAARNRGIREAKGELILFTDDDTIPHENWIEVMWEAFKGHDADCLGGKVLPLWLRPAPEWLKNNKVALGNLAMLERGENVEVMDSFDMNFVYGANMGFRRTCLDEVGDFSHDFGVKGKQLLRGEETNMVERLFQAGKKIVHIPQSIVMHKVEPERVQTGYFRRLRFDSGKTKALMARSLEKRMPGWLLRECLINGFQSLISYGRGDRATGFAKELLFWFQAGEIYQRIRGRSVNTAGV